MKEWIETSIASLPRAIASTIHYLYLARIPFLGWIALFSLPLFATHVARPLVLPAYDLSSNLEGFFVGITYGLASGSIYFTARLITNLCSKRFRLRIDSPVQGRIGKVWAWALLIPLLLNILTVTRASRPNFYQSVQIAGAMLIGILVALLAARLGGTISVSIPRNPLYRSLVWFGIKIGLRKQNGYLYPISADKAGTANPAYWEYEDGQIRAVSYALIVIIAYCAITAQQIPPLVALMLLLSLGVMVLTGVTFFWDRYRLPLLAILVAYFCSMGFCRKADHYYPLWTRPEPNPDLAPSEIVGRAAQQRLPLVIVAAAGGGIQSAAWTTSVLNQLGKRLSGEPGGGYDLPHSVRLISGVSGGSVGAMFYAETFSETTPDFGHSFEAACSSALGPTIRGLLRQDLWRAIAPFFVTDIYDDRGRILEKEWCKNFDEKFRPNAKLANATLSGWGADALSFKRPALVLNSTIVETGERLAISTVPTRRGLIGETEFAKRYCADVAISTAARLSATFPFVTPTGRPPMPDQGVDKSTKSAKPSVPCSGGGQHLVDGGYYENSGLVGAIEWIDEALTDLTNPKTNPKNYPLPHNILLLVIDSFERPNDPEDPSQLNISQAMPTDVAHGVIYNLASPLSAVMNVRGTGQRSFARRLLRMFQWRWASENIHIRDVKIFFEVKNPQNREEDVQAAQKPLALTGKKPAGLFYIGVDPGKEPLSWHLRPSEISELEKEWIGFSNVTNQDNYQAILDFFKAETGSQTEQ
jgi:hypothetical protein